MNSQAITEYRFYDDKGNNYTVSKIGLKNNKYSSSLPTFGRWVLICNRSMGGSTILTTSGEMASTHLFNSDLSDDEKASKFTFSSADKTFDFFLSHNQELKINY